MSTAIGKRKRVRKACLPCHQRKRKCDTAYPCGMCTTYGYKCSYTGGNKNHTKNDDIGPLSPARPVGVEGGGYPESRIIADSTPNSPFYTALEHQIANPSPTNTRANNTSASSSIFDEQKLRCSGASAAMAFPHVLGMALGADTPPRTRSFAYNFGIRPEEESTDHRHLSSLISEKDLISFSEAFFVGLGPVGDVMDQSIYTQRCRRYYQNPDNSSIALAAIAAGVAALGSFLSPNRYPQETALVQYAKAILDDPASLRYHGIDHIVAWGMRVFYLRATTRPSNAWIASCTQMHLCEALGLYEEENIKKIASIQPSVANGYDADRLRRVFWVSWAGHNMLSYEYDRSPVVFRAVTCGPIFSKPDSIADQFVALIHIIPSANSPFHIRNKFSTQTEELFSSCKALEGFESTHPFLMVTKADIAFCFYRRLYQLNIRIPDDIINLVIDSGNNAITAAEECVRQGQLLWNVIGSVFQYTCILLAIDTPFALSQIGAAFRGLESLVKAADTLLTREALAIARRLFNLSMAKKRRELSQLEAVEKDLGFEEMSPTPEANIALPSLDLEIDWDQFLIDPYFSMLG
ncbi:hypothetical protein PENSTE_c002G07159 [Penicillium steckii]|uniref:Zn(2)-C6 fungal-type domain-containing protein n=1 Tax=Penicillium steckii TaxID=303698 RepID=A0A1V6TUC7_9EURO|nr:hypothetical protein PENSTE_c002G07159 [Penicillium steckii]